MKKFIALLLLSVFSFGAFNQTNAASFAQQPAKHLKKDGTPDKRFKENKTLPPPPVHAKKDGTPDMRYKDNKGAKPAPPKPAPPVPAKKKKK